jgi:peptidyl-prolyl cis-trans isomerase A (cyclophilin A)
MTLLPRFSRRFLILLCALIAPTLVVGADAVPATPRVRISTSLGSFTIELDSERAPLTTAHFLERVRAGHYNGTIFHRVVQNFIAQGGGYDPKFVEKPPGAPIFNESGNGLSNVRGSVGLARAVEPHSGTVQFYINLQDNGALNPQPSRWGYAVFGRVTEGMTTVDEIGNVATGEGDGGELTEYVPLKPIVIESAEVLP